MLTKAALHILGTHPHLSDHTIRLFLRMLAEWDLRRPRAWKHIELAELYGVTRLSVRVAFEELEEVGLIERCRGKRSVTWRINHAMWMNAKKRREFLKESREMEERESLVRPPHSRFEQA